MKIAVKDIEANPYRNLKKYPLSRSKVTGLKTSIKENGFWGGILVRKHPTKKGRYQMAFGHHRWKALKELKFVDVDNMIIYPLDDDDMLHRMFAENHETWGARPACILENVEGARDRLQTIFDAHTWETLGENTQGLFGSKRGFATSKGMGVGKLVILKYLGNLYNENQVKTALNILKDGGNGDIAINAAKQLPSLSHVGKFRKAVNEYGIPKHKQEKIAKEIAEEGVGKRGVDAIVAKHCTSPTKKVQPKPKPLPMLDDVISKTCSLISDLHKNLFHINGHLDNIQNKRLRQTFVRDAKELQTLLGKVLK